MGRLVKDEEKDYCYFIPAKLPLRIEIDKELLDLLVHASSMLGELKGLEHEFGSAVGFSSMLFIHPYLRKEAVLSSKIEGTVSTLYDVLEAEALLGFKGEESRGDLREVFNYIFAQEKGIKLIRDGKSIDIDLIVKLHSELLRHVRGEKNRPGVIREAQNYISRAGFPGIEDSVYVPPKAKFVKELLENLFDYMQSSSDINIVKVALMHYQFEAIHPFLDGNGRVGRLLIILYLIRLEELSQPILYMSEYFERNRDEYYRLLLEVSKSGKYVEWIKFFMKGVIQQSEIVLSKSEKLVIYYKEIAEKLRETRHSATFKLVDIIFTKPIITIPVVAEMLAVSYPAAKAAVYEAVKFGILQEQAGAANGKRPKKFVAQKILEIYNA